MVINLLSYKKKNKNKHKNTLKVKHRIKCPFFPAVFYYSPTRCSGSDGMSLDLLLSWPSGPVNYPQVTANCQLIKTTTRLLAFQPIPLFLSTHIQRSTQWKMWQIAVLVQYTPEGSKLKAFSAKVITSVFTISSVENEY